MHSQYLCNVATHLFAMKLIPELTIGRINGLTKFSLYYGNLMLVGPGFELNSSFALRQISTTTQTRYVCILQNRRNFDVHTGINGEMGWNSTFIFRRIMYVTREDYLSGRTALHFASVNGHAICLRLVLADFVPSAPFELDRVKTSVLAKLLNKAADELEALHCTIYAACGGNLKCCQILLARGVSQISLNCNGWLLVDVARMWGRHWLEPLLAPNSDSVIPRCPRSSYLSLPLLSVLNIAR
ncbi:E3 ubiquitin-protein ligase XBAT33 [Linum perenne]